MTPGGSTRRTLFYLMVAMFFGACMSVCLTPYVLTTLLRQMDAGVGLMALVPAVMQAPALLGFPAGVLLRNCDPRRASLWLYSGARLFILPLLVVSLLPERSRALAAALVLGSSALMGVLNYSATGPSNAWLSGIIPDEIQGAFIGKRCALCALVGGLLTPAVGWMLEAAATPGGGVLYCLLFAVAAATGFADLWFLGRAEASPRRTSSGERSFLAEALVVCRSAPLRRAAAVGLSSGLGWLVLAPFGIILYYELGMSKFAVGLVAAAGALGLAGGLVAGGRCADRRGPARTLLNAAVLGLASLAGLLLLDLAGFALGFSGPGLVTAAVGLSLLAAFSQGASGSAQIKYNYQTVRNGSCASFAFIYWAQNLAATVVLLAAALMTSVLAAADEVLKLALWPGFHYTQLLLAITLAAGVGALLWLRRCLVAEGAEPAGVTAPCAGGRTVPVAG